MFCKVTDARSVVYQCPAGYLLEHRFHFRGQTSEVWRVLALFLEFLEKLRPGHLFVAAIRQQHYTSWFLWLNVVIVQTWDLWKTVFSCFGKLQRHLPMQLLQSSQRCWTAVSPRNQGGLNDCLLLGKALSARSMLTERLNLRI